MKSPTKKKKSALEVLKKTPAAPVRVVLWSAGASACHVALPAIYTARAAYLMSRNTQEPAPKPLYFGCVPYLAAMRGMSSPADNFGFDGGVDVCLRFLGNFNRERGDAAKTLRDTIKAHLALIEAGFTPFTPHDYLEWYAAEGSDDDEARADFEAEYRGAVIYVISA